MEDSLGPEEAIERLFTLYGDDVYRYARFTLREESLAQDVVQEVFLRAFRSWDRFRQDSSAKTWLLHIARNYMYDLLRHQRVERQAQRATAPTEAAPYTLDTTVELDEVIGQLKLDYRQVFVLRYVQDLNIEETASLLGWSESKVKTTLHRAVKKLRSILEDDVPLQRESKKGGIPK